MKIIALIMAFLVLALSVMPCGDANAASEGKSKTELGKSHNEDDNSQQDDCSPFCTCTCCAGFSINHFIASLTPIPPYESTAAAAHLPASVLDVALPIWQPPQLV